MSLPKSIMLRSSTDDERLLEAMMAARMVEVLCLGRRVVIGTVEAAEVGQTVTGSRDRCLVVKRRATRQEFLDCAPLEDERDRAALTALTTPFYYELELWVEFNGLRMPLRVPPVTVTQ